MQLLRKHGIDLEDGNGMADGRKTKRLNRKEIEALMGDGNGQDGIFTWREKNRRKVCISNSRDHLRCDTLDALVGLFSVSALRKQSETG